MTQEVDVSFYRHAIPGGGITSGPLYPVRLTHLRTRLATALQQMTLDRRERKNNPKKR